MRHVFKTVLLFLTLCVAAFGQSDIFAKVEKLGVGMDGYTLGKMLDKKQQDKAKKNMLNSEIAGVYKFLDGNRLIVVDKDTNRVVVIRKEYKDLNPKKLKAVIGEAFFNFDEPTTLTHSKMFYWVYDENGKKYTEDEWEAHRNSMTAGATGGHHSKKNNAPLKDLVKKPAKKVKFEPFVTAKLTSSKLIDDPRPYKDGTAYVIISSEKLLKEKYDL